MQRLPSATPRALLAFSLLLGAAPISACRGRTPAPAATPDLAQYLPLGPLDGAPDPVAQKLCTAVVAMPAERRAACCPSASQKNVAPLGAADCTRYLSAGIRDKAVTLDGAAVDRCITAVTAIYGGCDWIAPTPPPLPEACAGLMRGARPSGSPCRSSLECADGLRCQGIAGDKPGSCAAPLDNGSACGGAATDPLAASLRQDDLDERHPECAGHCERQICTWPLSPDAPCEKSVQCDSQHHCLRGRCRLGAFAKLGEECTGPCAPGLRCAAGHCEQAPHGTAACDELASK